MTSGVAVAGTLATSINYRVAAPITVQALGVDTASATVNQTVTAGAKVVAEREQTLDWAVLVVRDQFGRNYDFPPAQNWSVGTTQKEFIASRTFDRPGTYTYWFGYMKSGAWTNLSPRQTITVGNTASPAPTASPSATATAQPSPTATATATATPTPTSSSTTRACPAFPAMPDGRCTGVPAGTTLRSCPTYLGTAGATYSGCLFSGNVTIAASNITIKNSKVLGRISVGYGKQTGFLLTDVEIDGQRRDALPAIAGSDYTCIRCNVHDSGRGADMGDNVVIQDSWFHDFYYVAPAHQTAISNHGSTNNKVIHNNLSCTSGGCAAAFSLYGDFGQVNNVLVEKNLFNTTGSYCTYAGSVASKPYPNGINIRYLNNLFGKVYNPRCGIYGPVASWRYNTGNVWSGNAWADGSGPVNP